MEGVKRYRIQNRITKQWWEGEAESAQEACKKAGWIVTDCWIRQYSRKGSGGWKKPDENDKFYVVTYWFKGKRFKTYARALNPQEAEELAVQELIRIGRYADCKIVKIKEA